MAAQEQPWHSCCSPWSGPLPLLGAAKPFAQAQPPLGVPRCKEEREEGGLQGESERASSVPYTVT